MRSRAGRVLLAFLRSATSEAQRLCVSEVPPELSKFATDTCDLMFHQGYSRDLHLGADFPGLDNNDCVGDARRPDEAMVAAITAACAFSAQFQVRNGHPSLRLSRARTSDSAANSNNEIATLHGCFRLRPKNTLPAGEFCAVLCITAILSA